MLVKGMMHMAFLLFKPIRLFHYLSLRNLISIY